MYPSPPRRPPLLQTFIGRSFETADQKDRSEVKILAMLLDLHTLRDDPKECLGGPRLVLETISRRLTLGRDTHDARARNHVKRNLDRRFARDELCEPIHDVARKGVGVTMDDLEGLGALTAWQKSCASPEGQSSVRCTHEVFLLSCSLSTLNISHTLYPGNAMMK